MPPAVSTDEKILDQLEITGQDEPVYKFLGLIWNLKENNLKPNSYFALNRRCAGMKSGSVTECVEDDDSFLGGSKGHSATPLKTLCTII